MGRFPCYKWGKNVFKILFFSQIELWLTDRPSGSAHASLVTQRRWGTGAVVTRTFHTFIWTVSTVCEAVTHQAGVKTLPTATLVKMRGAFSLQTCGGKDEDWLLATCDCCKKSHSTSCFITKILRGWETSQNPHFSSSVPSWQSSFPSHLQERGMHLLPSLHGHW